MAPNARCGTGVASQDSVVDGDGRQARRPVERAKVILDEAIRQVHELGCVIVADGTIDGNGVWFDSLRPIEKSAAPMTESQELK